MYFPLNDKKKSRKTTFDGRSENSLPRPSQRPWRWLFSSNLTGFANWAVPPCWKIVSLLEQLNEAVQILHFCFQSFCCPICQDNTPSTVMPFDLSCFLLKNMRLVTVVPAYQDVYASRDQLHGCSIISEQNSTLLSRIRLWNQVAFNQI